MQSSWCRADQRGCAYEQPQHTASVLRAGRRRLPSSCFPAVTMPPAAWRFQVSDVQGIAVLGIADLVKCALEAAAGPAVQQVADVDHKGARARRHVDPGAGVPDLQPRRWIRRQHRQHAPVRVGACGCTMGGAMFRSPHMAVALTYCYRQVCISVCAGGATH